jgi:hypothetical protein
MNELKSSDLAMMQLEEFLNQNGLGSSSTESGGLSGITSSGGFPFLGQAMRSRERAIRNQESMRQVNLHSQRNIAWNNHWAGQATQASDPNQAAFRQMTGAFLNDPAMSSWWGGSDHDLAFGLQNAVQSSRFRVGGARLFGDGPISNQLAMDLWQKADATFFKDGWNQLSKTSGFDRTEMGQIFSLMGSRGAFAGRTATGAVNYDEKTGMYSLGDTSALSADINKTVSDMTKPLRMLRDIVGPKEMGELVSIAESLSGVSLGVKNAEQTIRRTLSSAVTNASAFGLDAHSYLNFQGGIVEGFTRMGYGGATAAAQAESVAAYSQRGAIASQDAVQHRSFFTPVQTASKLAAGMMTQMAAADQDPKMQAYTLGLLMLQNGLGSAEDRNRLRDLYGNNQPTEKDLARIKDAVDEATGDTAEETVRRLGGSRAVQDRLSASNSRQLAETKQNVLMNRGTNQVVRANLESMAATMVKKTVGGMEFVAPSIDLHTWLAGTMEEENRMKIANILEDPALDRAGRQTKIRELMASDLGAQNSGEIEQRLGQIMSLPNYRGMQNLALTNQADSRQPNNLSKGDRLRMSQVANQAYSIYNDMTVADTSLLGGFLHGLFGKETVSDGQVMQYAQIQRTRSILNGNAHPGAEAMKTLTDRYVSEAGMKDGLGQFDLALVRNGTAAQVEKQAEIHRTMWKDAEGGNMSARDLDHAIKKSWTNLRSSNADVSENAWGAIRQLTVGRSFDLGGKRHTIDYLSKDRYERDRKTMEQAHPEFRMFQAMDSMGLLTKEEKAELQAAEKDIGGSKLGKDRPKDKDGKEQHLITDSRLSELLTKFATDGKYAEHKEAFRGMIASPGNADRIMPLLEKQWTAEVKDWKENKAKYETDGKLTEAGRVKRAQMDNMDEMRETLKGGGANFNGKLFISNFGQAVIDFFKNGKEPGSSAPVPAGAP